MNKSKSQVLAHNPAGRLGIGIFAAVALAAVGASKASAKESFIPKLFVTSTVPANGDLNPYGVAFVPKDFPSGGSIAAGDVLVSNFNNSTNLQGLGTTIVQSTPGGTVYAPNSATVFFTSPLAGLSTALGVLKAGFVVVGNVPTTDGTSATVGQGALQVLDKNGHVVATWTDASLLDGPWDLTIDDRGSMAKIYVSNVLNGTVTRLDVAVSATAVTVQSKASIATGYPHGPNAAALVLGPTGLALDRDRDTLYVASTQDNTIYAVSQADSRTTPLNLGTVVYSNGELRGPLALQLAPNGNLIAANGDAVNADATKPSEIVEITRNGKLVSEYNVDTAQGGAFGVATRDASEAAYNFAAIDDISNSVSVYGLDRF